MQHNQFPGDPGNPDPQDNPFAYFESQFNGQADPTPSELNGVQIPVGYLPEGIQFTESERTWEYAREGQRPDRNPELAEKREAAVASLAESLDAAYDKNSGVVTEQENGRHQLKMYLEQDRGIATLTMERYATSDGTVVDTMGYKQGKAWTNAALLVRTPGEAPRLMGAVTNERTGEINARPPGGMHNENSMIIRDAELWDKNFKTASAEKPNRFKAAARRLGRSALDNF